MVTMAERTEAEGAAMDARTEERVMLTVHDVARMLCCSPRTVYRLYGSGRMPRPIRLGALSRWPRRSIERWIEEGCPKDSERTEVLL